jgi:hypothetical protein
MDEENSQSVPLADGPGRPIVTTVKFRIPRAVAEGLQLDSIKRRARGAMVTDVNFDYEERRGGDVRITCSMPMAIFFVGEFRQLEARAKAQRNHPLVAETARAAAATFKAIEDGDRAAAAAVAAAAAAAAAAATQSRTPPPEPERHP